MDLQLHRRRLLLASVFAWVLAAPRLGLAEEAAGGAEETAPGAETTEPEEGASDPEAGGAEAETPSVDERIEQLGSGDAEARVEAVRALGEAGDPRAVAPLITALRNDPDPSVRGWAVRALHQLDTPEARAALVQAARADADARVRSLAVRLGGPAAARAAEAREAAPALPRTLRAGELGPSAEEMQQASEGRSRERRMIIAGWTTFGVTYGLSLLVGLVMTGIEPELGWPMLLPLIGTAGAGQNIFYDAEGEPELVGLGMMVWLNSMFQITSFLIAVFGHRIARQGEGEGGRARRGVTLAAGPGSGPGLSVAGWF